MRGHDLRMGGAAADGWRERPRAHTKRFSISSDQGTVCPSHMTDAPSIGVVIIGRNEGERLKRCLGSLRSVRHVVYVDSGSDDGSAAHARSTGAEALELDLSKPFSMARARNTGFRHLRRTRPELAYTQFVDGDCEVAATWMPRAAAFLDAHPDVAAAAGRRRERHPEHSVYNRLCDLEWNTPVGEARATGGDVLMRNAALDAVGGFDEALIAGEEPELCLRLRRAGWRIRRLDEEMTLHDANILGFRPWWRRMRRGGYGSLDVVTRLAGAAPAGELPFGSMVRSARVWTLGWAAFIAVGGVVAGIAAGAWWAGPAAGAAVWIAQALRIARAARRAVPDLRTALAHGVLTMACKWAQLAGQLKYLADRRAGRVARLIEYKETPA